MQWTPLPRSFYEPSARFVAQDLLGHWLIRQTRAGICGGPIVETEAYLQHDPACHAAPGRTKRNQVMFGPAGHAYVYFIYGAHYCINAVCQPAGSAEAVLIRAIEPAFGTPLLEKRRRSPSLRELTNGPAKLCEAMDINRALDGTDLCDPRAAVIIALNPDRELFVQQRSPISTSARIGIIKGANLPLRFFLVGSSFVSRAKPAADTLADLA